MAMHDLPHPQALYVASQEIRGEEVRGGAARKKVWYEPFVHAQI